MINIDEIVRLAIEDLYPDQSIPDEDNYLPNGDQYQAPDHEILDGEILIERKSRNTKDESQFYEKLTEIAKSQGAPFKGYGILNSANIIKKLPNPDEANRKMIDYSLSQLLKSVKKTNRKFEQYSNYNGTSAQIKLLIISDNTQISSSTDVEEQFFGRKMGGYRRRDDETGLIDSIIFIKHPKFVMDMDNSYWFKCLIKKRLSLKDRSVIGKFSAKLHNRVIKHDNLNEIAHKIQIERNRPLIV